MTTGNTEEDVLTMSDMLGNYLALARRGLKYWKRGLALFLAIASVGLYMVSQRARVYKSEATFQVQEADIPGAQERGDEEIQRSLEARAGQVYGSRTSILQVIRELHLYPTLFGRTSSNKIVDQFQGAFEKRVDHDVLHIGFTYSDAAVAQRVVQRMIRLFTEERQTAALTRAQQSLDTVTSQLNQLEGTLSTQEDQLERFITANQAMVDQIRARRQGGLVGAQVPVAARPTAVDPTASPATRRLRARLAQLRSQLDALQHPNAAPAPSENEPESVQVLVRSVQEARDSLAALRARGYTDQYPAVQAAQARVTDLEGQLRAERRLHGAAVNPSGMSPGERAQQIEQVQRDIADTSASLARSEASDHAGMAPTPTDPTPAVPVRSPDALTSTAEVEQQYDRLNADLATTRTQYQGLLQRKYDRQADVRRIQVAGGEQIRMIDPPSLPVEPEPPGKAKLGGIVLAVALLLGLGTSLISGFIDTRVYDMGDLRRWGEVPELPFVPDLHADAPAGTAGRGAGGGGAGAGPPGPSPTPA